MLSSLLAGLLLGLGVAAQVGPISVMCAGLVLRGQLRSGLAVGAAAATVDAVYAALGALGVAALLDSHRVRLALGLVGAAVLVWLGSSGIRHARRSGAEVTAGGPVSTISPARAFRTGLLATLTNPLTIASWASVFGAARAAGVVSGAGRSAALVLGVGIGTMSWFTVLSLGLDRLGSRLTTRAAGRIEVVAGLVVVGFGLALAVGVLAS